ncbi:MAG: DUF4344 domain-containing metallopeptidase [Jannaschia sp.]
MFRILLCLLCLVTPARADFVLSNLRMTLYHEVGHAVVDQMTVSMFGPEENAADSFAMVLADRLHSEAEMQQIIRDVTALSRIESERELFDPWDEYMPGAQRMARAVCLFHGLNPVERRPLARALGMPAEMADECAEQSLVIARSWRDVLDVAKPDAPTNSLRPAIKGKALRLLAKDIARVNAVLLLPRSIPVDYEDCGEDNAFYYHWDERIVICSEMVDALRRNASR